VENLTLNAELREITGSKVKQLRTNGKIPANLFGRGFENLNLAMPKTEFEKLFREAGSSTIVNLNVNNKETYKILIHEPQRDPVTDQIIHVDLYKVNMKEEIHTDIPLEFINESPAVRDLEGNLITAKDALEVKCLPDKLVSEIQVDISSLKTFEDVIKVSEIKVPEGIEVLNDQEEIVAQVTPPRSEEELEEMEQDTAQEEKAAIEGMEAEAAAEKFEGEGEGTSESTEEPKQE
jgi:large subunit ribosomal protein L25